VRRLLALLVLLAGCRRAPARADVLLWHTFDPDEAAVLERALAGGSPRVALRAVPFSRGQNVLRAALERGGDECPDVARVDAAWIPAFARRELIVEAPAGFLPGAVEPAAAALAEYGGKRYGAAQTFGCLALLSRTAGAGPRTLDELAARMQAGGPRDVRADGFWFLPWLFAQGGDAFEPASGRIGVAGAPAQAALTRLAELARGPREDDPIAALAAGRLALAIDGPWVLGRLAGTEVHVAPFPAGPDGPAAPVVGQIWVVGRCSKDPARAFRLIETLVSPRVAGMMARQAFAPPALVEARAAAPPVVQEFMAACPPRGLPRHEMSALLFDDLTPAVAAVLGGEATPAEALADVERAWRRRLAALERP